MSRPGPAGAPPERPLPECLTRLLDMPRPPPAPGPATPSPAATRRARSVPANRALSGTLVWALGYNLIGLAIIALLWGAMP